MDNLVDIFCITYNHEKYIRACLEGFVKQKTNFKFRAIVYDDCSTDNTQLIIKEYAEKYPNIIYPILSTKNIAQNEGFYYVNKQIFDKVNAKYLAFCEGDDYWTNENKLQKQVDFLEKNPEYNMCFHPTRVMYEETKKSYIYPSLMKYMRGFTFDNLLKCNFIQTSSIMYRWKFCNTPIEEFFPKDLQPGDWYYHLLHAKDGKIKMLNETMSVYRRHSGGIWYDNTKLILRYGLQNINFYENVYKNITNCSEKYLREVFLPNLKRIMDVYYKNNEFDKLQEIKNRYYEYLCNNANNINSKEFDKYTKYKTLFNILLCVSICLLIVNIYLLIHGLS